MCGEIDVILDCLCRTIHFLYFDGDLHANQIDLKTLIPCNKVLTVLEIFGLLMKKE